MKSLYLLRHAKSSWSDSSLTDEERPLAPRGRKAAKKMAKALRRRQIRPALVLCSASRRTQETLELISPALGHPAIETEESLYGAGSDALLARIRAVSDTVDSVLVVGHNPGLQDLAMALAPGSKPVAEKFPTGALAAFELNAHSWIELGQTKVRLVAYVVPREL
jgi:phosphohistidine phosphatase